MWAVIKRMTLPVLLLLGGTASLIYGAKYHARPVVEIQEIQVSITLPRPFSPLPSFAQPPPIIRKITRKTRLTREEPEPALIREVSIGGVTRLASGELRRTYSGKAPSLCPT